MASATKYSSAWSTTGKTKIPPWGARKAQPKVIDSAPDSAAPMTQLGSTRSGSAAAGMRTRGSASFQNEKTAGTFQPLIASNSWLPLPRSSSVHFLLHKVVDSAIAIGGTMPPTMTAAMTP